MRKVQIYTDGACPGNPGPGGYGAALLFEGHRKELSGGYRKSTNSRMELVAVIKGLEALREKCEVEVFSDSKFVVDAITLGWPEEWRSMGWQLKNRDRAKNIDLWQRLLELCETHKVRCRWVKGHSGVPDNERCDQLATEAANKPNLPIDEPYEGTVPIQLQTVSPQTLSSGSENAVAGEVEMIRRDLGSPDSDNREDAIFRAVHGEFTEIGPDLDQLMQSVSNKDLKSRCAWALGKLNYREAGPSLVAALSDRSNEVRTWSAWALGEIGIAGTEANLRRALACETRDDVRRAIGGALKKLNYDSTRVHEKELSKALHPPETQDPTLMALLDKLQELDWKTDAAEIVTLRAELRDRDPDFFDAYKSWVRRRSEIIVALQDSKSVFRS